MLDLEKQKGNDPYRERFMVEEPHRGRASISSSNSGNSARYSETFKVQARNGFIRKVYSILSSQLLITIGLSLVSTNSKGFQSFQINHMWLLWVSLAIEIGIMIAIMCNPSLGKTVPTNYVLLFAFTLAEAYSVSFFCIFFSGKTVITAALLTAAVVVALTFYAVTTKSDFTLSGGILYIIGSVLFMVALVNWFIQSSFMSMLIGAGFAILFGIYLVYDTQLIVGGKCVMMELDDYILGALMLYTDIIGLFMQILSLLGSGSND